MRRLFRKFAVAAISAGLVLNGIVPHANAGTSHHVAMHETVQQYADLVIEPTDDQSVVMDVTVPAPCSHDKAQCNKCCTACVASSVLPATPVTAIALARASDQFYTRHTSLVAHTVLTDPGIPKTSLN